MAYINPTDEIIINEVPRSNKTFKDYYADPEFKRKHLERMREKVSCPCGMVTSRSNRAKHQKTEKHKLILTILQKFDTPTKSKEINDVLTEIN